MAQNTISAEEFAQFKSISMQRRVDCMELYLIGKNGYRYSMQDVGAEIYGDVNYSYTVSLIHRCYNFAGQNKGRYCPGCRFEADYGYRVTRKDIEAFVRKYPAGTFRKDITFEDFLLTRVKSAGKRKQKANANNTYQPPIYQSESTGTEVDEETRRFLRGIGCVGVLVMIALLVTGFALRHWVISIFLVLMIIGAFQLSSNS